MRKHIFVYLSLLLTACNSEQQTVFPSLSTYVNPFIGATTNTEAAGTYHGLGKTFPGATAPFGMVQTRLPEETMVADTVTNILPLKVLPSHKCQELVGMEIWAISLLCQQ